MTAEMLIMNRSAVAFAADSAVTVTSGVGGVRIRKIYANANKLFELVRGRPVGMLIYNGADFVEVPWETLVKMYRTANRASSFDALTGYVDSFCDYLTANLDKLVTLDARRDYVYASIRKGALDFLNHCRRAIQEHVERDPEVRINKTFRRQIISDELKTLSDDLAKIDVAEWAKGLDVPQVIKLYPDALRLVPETFEEQSLDEATRKKVLRIAIDLILKTSATLSTTGIAIAGFGEGEVYPTVVHFRMGGVIADRLVKFGSEVHSISGRRDSIILPLAQITEAETFLTGIDPTVREQIEAYWGDWLGGMGESAKQIVGGYGLSAEQQEEIAGAFSAYGAESWKVFAEYMNRLQTGLRLDPIGRSAAFLSKGELASLAENLVDLASLRARISIDKAETVGGATDVAVVSPGDGFVWIKRKHYFDLEVNPTWAYRHGQVALRSDVTGA